MDYQYLLAKDFHPGSRVWVYQASRLFTLNEALEIEQILHAFTTQWKSHGTPVKGAGHLLFGQFIVLMADETETGVSGCSTDGSVRLIKEIEQQFGVNMFDRTTLAFIIKGRVQLLPLSQLQYAADNGFINGDTLYFNNLVQTKEELEDHWIIRVKNSWLAKRLPGFQSVS
jgi:hypothetical protein